MKQNKLAYALGQHVMGKVEKLLPYGMFVRLHDGTQAYIRRRELSWAGNIDPRMLWREDDAIEGKVIELAGYGQSMELSYRITLPDPWHDFAGMFRVGDVVEGAVKNITAHGIFVELRPGVDGLVSLSELATWPVQEPDDLVWPGDVVEAVIVHLDSRARRLRLSIRGRMQQLEVVVGIMKNYDLFSPEDVTLKNAHLLSPTADHPPQAEPFLPSPKPNAAAIERVGTILVVDDFHEFRQPLVTWLGHLGYTVDEAETAEAALAMVEQRAYGLLFVDLNLPGIDGLAFLERVNRRAFKSRAVLMSSTEWLPERSHEIEQVGVLEVFVKPLDLSEIEQLLTRLGRGETVPRWRATLPADTMASNTLPALPVPAYSTGSFDHQLNEVLRELVATSQAGAGLIFRLDPISRAVSITAQTGHVELHEEAIHSLSESPVRDVIEEGTRIFEDTMRGRNQDRFRKLLDLLPFESCIGVPIKAKGEVHHALFLLHPQPEAFTPYLRQDAVAAGALCGLIIEREVMEQRFRSLNQLMLSGQLAGGFSHEVYNKMSGLDIQLHNLHFDCVSYEGEPNQAVAFSEIRRATEELLTTFGDLRRTVELFQQLMRLESGCRADINTIVEQAIALLRPVLRKNRVKVETEFSQDIPPTFVNTVQLEQAFLNIMLNAMQHMDLKPAGGKILTITTTYQPRNHKLPLKIRFADTGLGIHRRLWDKIFSLGFTTRLGGTGQGLFITRSLIESQGGRVSVERSVVPLGSTFLVELPVDPIQEK
ncbi:MAG: S1 RNA-binding domain-containing protein [Anaerolineae bacterium]|nr:S1 RNA-binding domain-containing protein [Anaerolineae bacterium]